MASKRQQNTGWNDNIDFEDAANFVAWSECEADYGEPLYALRDDDDLLKDVTDKAKTIDILFRSNEVSG